MVTFGECCLYRGFIEFHHVNNTEHGSYTHNVSCTGHTLKRLGSSVMTVVKEWNGQATARSTRPASNRVITADHPSQAPRIRKKNAASRLLPIWTSFRRDRNGCWTRCSVCSVRLFQRRRGHPRLRISRRAPSWRIIRSLRILRVISITGFVSCQFRIGRKWSGLSG